nr:EOG090X036X [Megafenestra aurita]
MDRDEEWPILKRLLTTGRNGDAVRFGRVPKREKAKILAAMQSVNARLAERSLPAEFADEVQLMQAVVRAHMETCDFTRDKVQVLMADAHRQPNYTACPPTLACPLNPTPAPSNGQQQLLQDFSERFLPAIRDVVEFAKRLPGFTLLAEDDKVTLLKPGVFEVLLVRLATMFDSQSNTMLCLNGQLLRRDALHNSSNARFLMDSMFEFAERLNSLALNDAELGLFCAVVVIASDRPGLRNVELVERMQSKLRSVLENVLNQAHPEKAGLFMELLRKIPDLRTLNTLHSEKLLAFKMTEQQQQQQHYNLHPQQQTPPPPASPWHDRDSYDEEGAKSPMGSVSSSGADSICSGVEGAMSDLPLLAAVAGSAAPLLSHRRRPRGPSENGSSSMSSDGEETDSNRSLSRIVESPPRTHSAGAGSSTGSLSGSCPYSKLRKLDSPDDSGIESGVDRYEKLSTASRSTNTSLCSSPRSSLEDKVKEVEEMHHHQQQQQQQQQQHHHHHHHHHHVATSSPSAGRVGPSSVDDMPVLKRVLQAPPLFDTNSLMDEAYKPHKKFRALTLQRKGGEETPMRVPAVSPPRSSPSSSSSTTSSSVSVLSAALSSPPGNYSALCSALTSPPASSTSSSSSSSSSSSILSSTLSSGVSSLTSTHSTLARSLMEGPKMISTEQQRRADLIVANIMKGNVSGSSPTPSSSNQSYSMSPSPHSSSSSNCSVASGQQQRTVLTSGPLYVSSSPPSSSSSSSSSSSCWNYHQRSPASPQHHASPSPRGQQREHQPELLSASIGADSQPLNLSLKSPSSSPARPTTPVTHTHYFPLHA